jgi:hypothetical protein
MSDVSGVHILGAFLDTLYLNVYPTDASFQIVQDRVKDDLRSELEALKQRAQDEEESIPSRFVFDGCPLLMTPKGAEGFNWILKNTSINLCVNRSSKMALLGQVRCSSEYLWKVRDVAKIMNEVFLFLTSVFGQYIALQPSAVDLAVDLLGFQLPAVESIKECFVSRAQYSDDIPANLAADGLVDGPEKIKRRWGRITGLPFGGRASALSGIIYDKTHEIRYHSPQKAWFYDLWREACKLLGIDYSEDMQVLRVELRFRRSALREMKQVRRVEVDGEMVEETLFHGIDDAFMLESYLPGLWAYAVGHASGGTDGLPDGWLRYVVPTEDTNRSRWPVHPDWQVVQSAYAAPALVEPESDYERAEREKEELNQEVDAYLEAHPELLGTSEQRKQKQPVKKAFVVPGIDPLLFNLSPYIRERKRRVNVDQMVAQVTGCLSTLEAWTGYPDGGMTTGISIDISVTLSSFYDLAQEYMQKKNKDFSRVVDKKRVLYSIVASAA